MKYTPVCYFFNTIQVCLSCICLDIPAHTLLSVCVHPRELLLCRAYLHSYLFVCTRASCCSEILCLAYLHSYLFVCTRASCCSEILCLAYLHSYLFVSTRESCCSEILCRAYLLFVSTRESCCSEILCQAYLHSYLFVSTRESCCSEILCQAYLHSIVCLSRLSKLMLTTCCIIHELCKCFLLLFFSNTGPLKSGCHRFVLLQLTYYSRGGL